MTRCDKFQDALAAEAAGEIDAATEADLTAHLEVCTACARDRDRLRAAIADLEAGLAPDPGTLYWASFDSRLRQRIAAARTAARRRARVVAAAAVVAACGIGLGVILRVSGRPGGPEQAVDGGGAAAEARLEAAIRVLRGEDGAGTAGALEAILDDIAPGDPFALAGGLDDIDSEAAADPGV